MGQPGARARATLRNTVYGRDSGRDSSSRACRSIRNRRMSPPLYHGRWWFVRLRMPRDTQPGKTRRGLAVADNIRRAAHVSACVIRQLSRGTTVLQCVPRGCVCLGIHKPSVCCKLLASSPGICDVAYAAARATRWNVSGNTVGSHTPWFALVPMRPVSYARVSHTDDMARHVRDGVMTR